MYGCGQCKSENIHVQEWSYMSAPVHAFNDKGEVKDQGMWDTTNNPNGDDYEDAGTHLICMDCGNGMDKPKWIVLKETD